MNGPILRPGLVLLLLFPAGAPAAAPPEGPPIGDALRATLQAEHRAGRFDGVALVARGDALLGEYAFGEANRAFRAPHVVDEPFPVASVTKQWVAVMILQLVEQGKLALDDPLAKSLPQVDRPWTKAVTLRQLLAHRSGLPQPEAVIPDFYRRPDLAPDAIALAKLLAERGPVATPGEAFSYNNSDYVFLAAAIEAVRGVTLAEALRTQIVAPAKLAKTGLIAGREVILGLPQDYDLDAGVAKVAPRVELANFHGAGAGYSSVRDLWAIDRALMANTLLKPETTAMMLDSSPSTGYFGLGSWIYPLGFAGGKTLRIVERHGSIGGYHVVNLYVPESGVVVVLATNISTFTDPQTWGRQGLAYALLKQVVEDEARDRGDPGGPKAQ